MNDQPNEAHISPSELNAGLGRALRRSVKVIEPALSRGEWHDKAWALYHAKTFDDTMLAKVNIHTIRAVFDATYDALIVKPNDKLRGE